MIVGQIALQAQNCSNCRFARRSIVFERDAVLSCRYLPPQPFPTTDWRLVPENFWCGCWEQGPIEPLTSASRRTGASAAITPCAAEANPNKAEQFA